MSRSSPHRWSVRSTSSKPCAFCRDTECHISRCQTLANTECKYCHELGHTTRHCSKIKEKKRRENQQKLWMKQRMKQQHRNKLTSAVWGDEATQATEDGWNVVTTSSRSKSVKTNLPKLKLTQRYAFLEQVEPVEQPTTVFAGPKPVTPLALKGAWAKKSRVTFAHDATGEDEIRFFDKNAPASAVSSCDSSSDMSDEDAAYFASKTSSGNAWKPAFHNILTKEEVKQKKEAILARLAEKRVARKSPAVKKSWADIADDDSDSDSD